MSIIDESPNRSFNDVIWDDRSTPVRNNDRMVGRRQRSSNELKNAVKTIEKRYYSSPVLSAAEIASKAEEDRREFEEFARLLRGEQKFSEQKKSPMHPRNLMNNLNENLNDSIVDSSKPILPDDDLDQDSFLDEAEMANLEAEAVKTLGSFKGNVTTSNNNVQTSVTEVIISKPNILLPKNNTNDEDDDEIMMAIPIELLRGENITNKPISLDYKAITQNQAVPKAPTINNLPSTSANKSKMPEKLNAIIPKKRVASDCINFAAIKKPNVAEPPTPPVQRKATPAEIEEKKQEAIRRRKAFLENQQKLRQGSGAQKK